MKPDLSTSAGQNRAIRGAAIAYAGLMLLMLFPAFTGFPEERLIGWSGAAFFGGAAPVLFLSAKRRVIWEHTGRVGPARCKTGELAAGQA